MACCLVYVNSEDMIVVTIHFSPVPPCVICKARPLIPPTSGILKDRCEKHGVKCVSLMSSSCWFVSLPFFHPALALGPFQPGHLPPAPPADSEVCDSSHPVGSQTTESCVVVVVVYLLLRGSRDYFLLSG